MTDDQPLFDRVDGAAFFIRLVDRFYAGVMDDPVLAPLYEVDDLDGARHRLSLFLMQYWGGPTTYDEERGHPRLRMRHAPYVIGTTERDRWLVHMTAAVDAARRADEIDDADRARLLEYFVMAADHMINSGGLRLRADR
ncbi:MAG: globin [Acidobacteria bacterium]|nr:globin [Acidobacteriota bacterium]